MPATSPRRPSAPSAAALAVKSAFKQAPPPAAGVGAVPAALRERRRKTAQTRLRKAVEARTNGHVPADLHARLAKLVAAWSARGFDDGFGDAEAFEKDCYEVAEIVAAKDAGKPLGFLLVELRYRAWVIGEYGKIELRGLQMSERVYQTLDEAYLRMWIQDDSSEGEVVKAGQGVEFRVIPRLTVEDLVTKYERAVIVGAPGSGKSTVMAYLATQVAAGKLGGEKPFVPFVVPVRSLGGVVLDADTIARTVREVDTSFVQRMLEEKRALVLIDGLDEAQAGPGKLIPGLKAFAEAHPGNRVVVTSRPAGGAGSERVEVPGFATTTLLPMEREDVYKFIDQWCTAAELSIQTDAVRARADAKVAADDLKARVRASTPVEKLARTPILCSVVCVVHRFLGHKIPERRAALYEVCTNVLLYEWDRAKFPEGAALGKLDAQQKRYLLGGLARWMHDEKVAEAPEDEVLRVFTERLPHVGDRAEDAKTIIREIQARSGILVERRPGFYGFSHLTFQEYLTAVELARIGEVESLAQKYGEPWWREVTVLAVGLPGVDAASLIRGLLEPGRHDQAITAATFLAAECAEAAVHLPPDVRERIDARLKRFVPPRDEQDMKRLVDLGDTVAPILIRAIDPSDPRGQGMLALTLGELAYEPSISVLTNLSKSSTIVEHHYSVPIGNTFLAWIGARTLGNIATCALFNLATKNIDLRPFVERSISAAPAESLQMLEELSDLISIPHGGKNVRDAIGEEAAAYLSTFLRQ